MYKISIQQFVNFHFPVKFDFFQGSNIYIL
jgi:hypothetical protein